LTKSGRCGRIVPEKTPKPPRFSISITLPFVSWYLADGICFFPKKTESKEKSPHGMNRRGKDI
jgi:hypothetical protein